MKLYEQSKKTEEKQQMLKLSMSKKEKPSEEKREAENPPTTVEEQAKNPQALHNEMKSLSEQEYSVASSETGKAHSIDEPTHFDALIGAEEEAEQAAQIEEAASNMLGADDFHALFCVGFGTASHLTGLQSLKVDKEDGAAQACTRAIYDTIQDIPALHFLLMPQNKWFERAFAIGMFTVPMAAAVSAEINAKKAAARPVKEQPAKPEKTDSDLTAMSLRDMAVQ